MATTLPLAAGRIPPHDLDAEISVIGSVLLEPLSIAKVLQFLHPEDFYRENNGQIYRAALDQRERARMYDLLGPAMERISILMESGQGVVGIPSGFHDLDRMTGGFKDSDLIIVAGRPSMGKCARDTTLIDDPTTGERMTI